MMAGNTPIGGFSVLPQFQGNMYDLQTKQAIAQALIQKGLQGDLQNYQPAGGGFAYVPKYGASAIAAQLGNALLGSQLQKEAGEGLTQLGQQQAQAFQQMFAPQTQAAPNVEGANPMASGSEGANPAALGSALAPQTRTVASPLNPMGMSPQAAGFLAQTMGWPAFAEKFIAPSYAPTDTTKLAMQAGLTPEQIRLANAGQITKNNLIALSPGQTAIVNGQREVIPNIGEGMEEVTRSDGSKLIIPRAGYTGTVAAIEGAKAGAGAGARAQFEPREVYNPQTRQMEFTTTANVVQNASGAQTPFQRAQVTTESNGNPNAVSPKGAMGAWQVMPNTNANPGFGVTPARDNSRAELDRVGREYSDAMVNRYGGNQQLGAIAYNMGPGATDKWLKAGANWEQLPAETRNYMGKVSLLTAMNQQQQAPQQAQGGPMLARAPFGAPEEATAGAQGRVTTMNESYKGLRTARDSAQNAITLLDDMQKYGQDKNPVLANKLYNVANLYSTDAQLFDKARNNLIAQVSGSTGMGTDQARSIVEGSIPSYGMSQAAIQEGLRQVKAQVQMRQIKSDYMSDAYAAGDARQYNQRENQFDQVMTPDAASIIKMQPGQQRNAAIQAAKNNPRDADALRWAIQTGVLR